MHTLDTPLSPGPLASRATRDWFRRVGMACLVVAVLLAIAASLAIGSRTVPFESVIGALLDFDPVSADQAVVRQLRLPRTLVGLLAGAALPIAGALMQALTRNLLAGPGLLGINSGAALAVVLGSWLLGIADISMLVWLALVGAVVSMVVVYAVGSIGGSGTGPVRLALAGAAVTALMFALTRAVTLIDRASLEQYRFWVVGSLTGRDGEVVASIVPFIAVGTLIAFALTRSLNLLSMGEETARALGAQVGLTRAVAGLAIMLLAGAAVAGAGPILFVGLVIPHAARAMFGPDHRWLIPGAGLAGAALLLVSDTLGRVIAPPAEIQVGIVMAAIGGPAFVLVVRRMRELSL